MLAHYSQRTLIASANNFDAKWPLDEKLVGNGGSDD